ncbi:MAG: prolipoprotein diacylglyceryl transferase [Spirochaetales bacterium]|nr:prolipoprotein diacylglyceryl transferase [Spirochaetales bacterium]
MLAYMNYPKWIKPEIIPGLPFRWYAVMYIVAFAITYFLMMYQLKKDPIGEQISKDDAASYFFWVVIGLIVGARVFGTLVYDTSGTYIKAPWLIIWPFKNGKFSGLSGMSYHGGLIGALAGSLLFCKVKKKNFLLYTDLITAGIPLGYTFGRLGNFINAELYGRVTASPLGMVFPNARKFGMNKEWVIDFVEKHNLQDLVRGKLVNLPRHPSQLYEAFFEGLVLWAVLWFVFRKRKRFPGMIISLYIIGYGLFRFFIEYAREPDENLGYVISFFPSITDYSTFQTFFNFSLGQVFCFLMILAGIGALFYFRWRENRTVEIPDTEQEKENTRRLRKKIK